jgi:formate dehydrogenase subunit gamma
MAIQQVHDRLAPPDDDRDLGVEGDDRVHRFGRTERLLHWWIVAMFGAALLTGIAMGDEAESGSLLRLHIGSVVLMGIGFVLALVLGDFMAVLRSGKDLFIFDRTDISFVVTVFSHPERAGRVRWGKFNIGQKVLAWALVGSVAAIIVTGINSWSAGEGASGPHAAAVAVALVLLGAHVFMALINPTTRPALPGMVLGHVRRTWAAKHHPAWMEEQDRRQSLRSRPR